MVVEVVANVTVRILQVLKVQCKLLLDRKLSSLVAVLPPNAPRNHLVSFPATPVAYAVEV